MKKTKIMMLGCLHAPDDARIVERESQSLVSTGKYEVVYYTNNFSGKEFMTSKIKNFKVKEYNLPNIFSLNHWRNPIAYYSSLSSNFKTIKKIVLEERPDVVHIHEFILMNYVKVIKSVNPKIKIIYDVHEDYEQLYFEEWCKTKTVFLSEIGRRYVGIRNRHFAKISDAVITVVPYLTQRYNFIDNLYEIRNYPIISDTKTNNDSSHFNMRNICYVGGISKERGLLTLLECVDKINGDIYIAGGGDAEIIQRIGEMEKDYTNLHYLGWLDRSEVNALMKQCSIGVCTLKHTPAHEISFPVKLFEYMSHSLAVVCSDIKLWEEIVNESRCGIIVNPDSVDEIVDAINNLLDNESETQNMGGQGRRSIEEKYCWNYEKNKLLELYDSLREK